MDLSGWKVVSNGNEFVFPDSSNIQPKGYLLLSANPQEMVLLTNVAGIECFAWVRIIIEKRKVTLNRCRIT